MGFNGVAPPLGLVLVLADCSVPILVPVRAERVNEGEKMPAESSEQGQR